MNAKKNVMLRRNSMFEVDRGVLEKGNHSGHNGRRSENRQQSEQSGIESSK